MRERNIHLLLTMSGIAGIAAVYLPFTYDISPMIAAPTELWVLALPFFLSIPVFAASIRWILSGSLSLPERIVAYALSAASTGATLSLFWPDSDPGFDSDEWIAMAIPIVVLLSGVFLLIRDRRARRLGSFRPVMTLQVAYLANAILCLYAYFEDGGWQMGAYCVLLTVIAYIVQIRLVHASSGASSRVKTGAP